MVGPPARFSLLLQGGFAGSALLMEDLLSAAEVMPNEDDSLCLEPAARRKIASAAPLVLSVEERLEGVWKEVRSDSGA